MVNDTLPVAPVALGYEAPIYVTVRNVPDSLLKARIFYGNRPGSAGAGPTVMSQGLVIMSYVFKRLFDGVSPRFDTRRLPMDLQVFRAMVSDAGKPEQFRPEADAIAVSRHYANGAFHKEGSDVLSLAAAVQRWKQYIPALIIG